MVYLLKMVVFPRPGLFSPSPCARGCPAMGASLRAVGGLVESSRLETETGEIGFFTMKQMEYMEYMVLLYIIYI
jgi:hypothetical protein